MEVNCNDMFEATRARSHSSHKLSQKKNGAMTAVTSWRPIRGVHSHDVCIQPAWWVLAQGTPAASEARSGEIAYRSHAANLEIEPDTLHATRRSSLLHYCLNGPYYQAWSILKQSSCNGLELRTLKRDDG